MACLFLRVGTHPWRRVGDASHPLTKRPQFRSQNSGGGRRRVKLPNFNYLSDKEVEKVKRERFLLFHFL